MKARSMIIVAGGSSERFGADKLMVEIDGRALIAHTVSTITPLVDECTLVVRSDQIEAVESLGMGVNVIAGGKTRTGSEINGVLATSPSALMGIHDGARPTPDPDMIERLFVQAGDFGGAVPALPVSRTLVDRANLTLIRGAVRVQTPQVFWGPELKAAYLAAARVGFEGHDTADVIRNFTSLEIAVVVGDPANIKVTYPEDLEFIKDRLL